jgi:hypothetical protein
MDVLEVFRAPVEIWVLNIKEVSWEGEYKWTWLKPLLQFEENK